jgi:DNA-binding GntR family transcriptional regulator
MNKPIPAAASKSAATSDSIAAGIAQAIHEQRLEPGVKLGEDEVGEIYGVSRTIVRAALKSLEHSGLITFYRNRGAFVSQPTVAEAREVFEARALLEPRMARAVAERATPADLQRLRAQVAAEHECLHAGETQKALFLSGQFHVEVSRLARQRTIAKFVEALVGRSSLIIALYRRRQSPVCESDAHERLLEAFAKGSADEAEREMKRHIEALEASLDLEERTVESRPLKEVLAGFGKVTDR